MIQDANDSTRWIGVLALPKGQIWDDVRFIVQAVNGVGLVTLVTNFGDYFIPGIDPGHTPTSAQATTMTLISPPTSGPYGTLAEFTAQLDGPAEGGSGIPNQVVEFSLGSQRRQIVTDANGQASVAFPLIGIVGQDVLQVSFAGNATYKGSIAFAPFTINRQATSLILDPQPGSGQYSDNTNLQATLFAGADRRLPNTSVFFVAGTPAETLSATSTNVTDYAGRAPAGPVNLPAGIYPVTVYFLGTIPLGNGQTITTVRQPLPGFDWHRLTRSIGRGFHGHLHRTNHRSQRWRLSCHFGSGRSSRRRFTWRPDAGLGGVRRAQWPQSGRGNSHRIRDCWAASGSVYPWFTGRQILR